MNKKLLAVAVAGVFAAPAAAFAQSSVTISGAITMTVDNVKYSDTAKTTRSESRLNDESSSIIFNVREDLGGGMSAIVKVDVKPNPDSGAIAASGESFVGISTKTAGRFTAGRHNFHFFKTPWDGYGLSGGLKSHPSSLIDFAGGGKVAIANATRTPNSLMWSSPKWGGFAVDVGYSFNPGGGNTATEIGNAGATEADLTAGNTARRGRAWMLNPTFSGTNWHIGYSYWNGKPDAPTAVTATGVPSLAVQLGSSDQRSDSLYGYYTWGGFKLGLMWNKSKLNAAATAAGLPAVGTQLSNRTAWSIPIRYSWANHHILAHYTKARDDKATAAQDGAKMWALMYAYSLSKRTSVSLSYTKLTNDGNATAGGAGYNLYTNIVLGSANAGTTAGEDVRALIFGVRHNF
ncbi:MAG: porin [Pseudomonadota bacterium]